MATTEDMEMKALGASMVTMEMGRSRMLYGSEAPITKALAFRVEVAELRMLRWTCGKTMVDMISNEVFNTGCRFYNRQDEGRKCLGSPPFALPLGLLSRFMQEPEEQHMKAIKKVLRYVKGTKDYGITYKHSGGNKIHGYSDSSYEVNTQEGKGTTGIIFYYGESPISWNTQKQATVALSSCES
nr:ribonuclease H-like domain, reverse transcriptase, RNA-dependent DNA polymerase [Tanacetum cinerariifolium]